MSWLDLVSQKQHCVALGSRHAAHFHFPSAEYAPYPSTHLLCAYTLHTLQLSICRSRKRPDEESAHKEDMHLFGNNQEEESI